MYKISNFLINFLNNIQRLVDSLHCTNLFHNSICVFAVFYIYENRTVESDSSSPGAGQLEQAFQQQRSNVQVQAEATAELVGRILPRDRHKFVISVNRTLKMENDLKDVAFLKAVEGEDRLEVRATSGAAAAWGINHYLKYWCDCHISWDSEQLDLPRYYYLPPFNRN